MKKVFFALLALSLGCVGLTSCENGKLEYTADPSTQPIAGKTYRASGQGDSYAQFTFFLNYSCTMVTKRDGEEPVVSPYFEWYMSPNDPDVVVRYAQGTYNKETGQSLSGKTFLSGSYNASTKTVTLTGTFEGKEVTYTMTEVQ